MLIMKVFLAMESSSILMEAMRRQKDQEIETGETLLERIARE